MRNKLFKIALITLFLSCFFMLAVNAQEEDEGEQILRIIHPRNSGNWSPFIGAGHEVRWISLQWASPMYFDKNGEIQPYVFSEWKGNEDNTVWTFTIAGDAVFSDGSPITAEDVVGTWNLCVRPSTQHLRADLSFLNVAGYDEVSTGEALDMSGLVAKDSRTVEVTLSRKDPIFYQRLATALVPPVKISQAADSNGEQILEWWAPENGVVVSGPFMPESMDLDTGVINLVKNPNFFGPEPKLDKIIITTVKDEQTATLLLQRGEMDAHTELMTTTMIQDLGKEFVEGAMLAKGHHFWFNCNRPPMDDINVRKALILAVDSKKMFEIAFPYGPHKPATQILNKVKGTDPEYEMYTYDPEAARAALAKSSYGSAENLPKLMFVGISTPSHELAAQYIAEQWRQILGIQGTEMKPQQDSYQGPDQMQIQIFRDDVGTRVPDIAAYLMGAIHSSSGNATGKMGGYKNAEIDALLEEASMKSVDNPERISLSKKAQEIFRDEWQFIPYYHETMSKWAMPWVLNFDKNDDWQVIEPWSVSIDEELKEELTSKYK